MSEYISAAYRERRRTKIGKVGGWLTAIGAYAYVSLTTWERADSLQHTKLELPTAQAGAGGEGPKLSELAGKSIDFVSEQAHNATVVSGLIGALVLGGLGVAARWTHRRSLAREQREAEEAARQVQLHQLAIKEAAEAEHLSRVRAIESTRPKDLNEMDLRELKDLLSKRAALPLGNGLYQSPSYWEPHTGDGYTPSGIVEAHGPVRVEFRDGSGNYYIPDMPTAEYAAVA